MKKTALLLLFVIGLIGCKSTAPTVNNKLDNKKERMIKGDWSISSVDYAGSDYIKVTSFNIEDSKCFVGSNWKFISNNNKGEMGLNNRSSKCKDFNSPITWYINKNDEFVFKIINDYKAKEATQGFVLKIENITETSFQLIDKINVAGQIKNITYTFQRK